MTDATGSLREQQAYDSFGNSTGSSLTRYTYTAASLTPTPSAALPPSVRQGSALPARPLVLGGYASNFPRHSRQDRSEAQPRDLESEVGKAELYRTMGGKAALVH